MARPRVLVDAAGRRWRLFEDGRAQMSVIRERADDPLHTHALRIGETLADALTAEGKMAAGICSLEDVARKRTRTTNPSTHPRRSPTPPSLDTLSMYRFLSIALIASIGWLPCPDALATACLPGAYGLGDGDFVVVVPLPNVPPPDQRYLFRDGRRGSTSDAASPVDCVDGALRVRGEDGLTAQWPRLVLEVTDTTFASHDTRLAGRLIEPGTRWW